MAAISIQELREHANDLVERAAGGEVLTITRNGTAVAELGAARRPPLAAGEILARSRHLPVVDAGRLRSDLDATLDAGL